MRQPGFSLSEIMLYIAIASLLMTMFLKQSLDMLFKARKIHEQAQLNNNLYRTLFHLDAEIQFAPRSLALWRKMTQTECIWHTESGDKGWVLHQGILYHIKGAYDASHDAWNHTKRAPFLRNVHALTMKYTVQNKVLDCITMMVTCAMPDGYTISKTISIAPRGQRAI